LIVAPNGKLLGERTAIPTQGKVPVQEWKPGNVYREIYAVPVAAATAGADSAEIRISLFDPGSSQPWQALNAGDAAPYRLTALKIVR
jgi:hypothetical protein